MKLLKSAYLYYINPKDAGEVGNIDNNTTILMTIMMAVMISVILTAVNMRRRQQQQ